MENSKTGHAGDPRNRIEQSEMTARQWIVVALCVMLNGLDGFDVLSISYAAPGIAQDWGVDRAALGIVLSMELIGMAIGSVVLGPVADRLGHRPVTLVCLGIMALGMASAAHSRDLVMLSAIRLLTGLGIGGLLACINAVVAEAANARRKATAVALMAAGYPGGAVLGGTVASFLLAVGNWRDIFTFGAIVTALMIPAVWWLVPESIDGLMRGRSGDLRLGRINAALAKLGHAPVSGVRPRPEDVPARLADLFSGRMRAVTLTLIAAYFAHMMTFYFLLKWTPKIVVDMGYAPAQAGAVLVWVTAGGLVGSLMFSAAAGRVSVKALSIGSMLGSCLFIALFGFVSTGLASLSIAAALAGLFGNAAAVGLYAAIALAYPAYLRAGGTGLVIGFGRGGAALGPVAAGLLFAIDPALGPTALVMALGSLAAALLLWRLPIQPKA